MLDVAVGDFSVFMVISQLHFKVEVSAMHFITQTPIYYHVLHATDPPKSFTLTVCILEAGHKPPVSLLLFNLNNKVK